MKKTILFLFGFLALLATSWALWNPNFFRLHDFVHAARIVEMTQALKDGHFPVRWTRDFSYGYGMPLFEFYAPLPFYVGSFFYWLGMPIILSIKLLFILCSLVTFIGMYRLSSRLFGRAGGILSATALTLAPYRAVNLYVRGALSEAWGIMALPWILLGIVLVLRREKSGWLTLLFGLIMLFLSHNITTMLFIPMSILFGAGMWVVSLMRKEKVTENISVRKTGSDQKKTVEKQNQVFGIFDSFIPVLKLAGTYILGIGLAAFYLFPAFIEKDATKVNRIFGGYFSYGLHFLYIRQFLIPNWGYGGSNWGPQDGLSFFLGYGQLAGLLITVLLFLKMVSTYLIQKKNVKKNADNTFHVKSLLISFVLLFTFLIPFMIAIFMSLMKSEFIWKALSFLAVAQFPWRWLSVVIVFLALLVGLGTRFIKVPMIRWTYAAALSIFILVSNFYYFRPESYLKDPNTFYYTDTKRIREEMSDTLNDYIPVQMPDPLPAVSNVVISPVKEDGPQMKVEIDRTQEKLISTHFDKDTKVEFGTADFPGWQAYVDGEPVSMDHGAVGNILVHVPAGDHVVGIQFGETPVRAFSDGLSVLSLVVFSFLVIQLPRKRKNYDYTSDTN